MISRFEDDEVEERARAVEVPEAGTLFSAPWNAFSEGIDCPLDPGGGSGGSGGTGQGGSGGTGQGGSGGTGQGGSGGTGQGGIGSFPSTLGMAFVEIPSGSFIMGEGALNSVPSYPATVGEPFFITAHEVTNAQYEVYDPDHPRHETNPGDGHPVSFVKWQNAKDFCAWLTAQDSASGMTYRLPTEVEWEWAARGGDAADIDTPTRSEANSWGVGGDDVWVDTGPVGSLKPNDFGLFDTLGNVSEWVTTPEDGSKGYRIHKGRSFNSGIELGMTPGDRQSYSLSEHGKKVGFRVVAVSP